ncbi:MAG: DUF488 domain-containing protein [Proteobacteria bacterium]|nr:DUF488 domain-containing protein [Pseudomonadota bacterium]
MGKTAPAERPRVYTIGHSNHSRERFWELLSAAGVKAVADVRSRPMSRRAPWTGKHKLAAFLDGQGAEYLFLGDRLGGMPADPAFYDEEGYALYGLMAESPAFAQGLAALEDLARRSPTVLMCAEESPEDCHRGRLIARVLATRGWEVIHLRAGGQAEAHGEALQGSLFPGEEDWKSPRPVVKRK